MVGNLVAPGFGLCNRIEGATAQSAPLHCRFPLGEPHKTMISAIFTQDRCPTDSHVVKTFPMTALHGELHPDPVNVSFTSVNDSELNFGDVAGNDSDTRYNGFLCPGTPVTFTRYYVVRRARYTVVARDVLLPR